jgi:hypothetical protein
MGLDKLISSPGGVFSRKKTRRDNIPPGYRNNMDG